MNLIYYLLIPLTAVVNTAGQVLLKLGAEELVFKGSVLDILKTGWKMLAGLFFFGLTFVLSTVLNKKFDVSLVYPIMTGLTFIMLSVVMVIILKKEPMSILKGLGMFVIISGILLMSLSQKFSK
jgi:multidrug transporter EmrE-like cation transporter